MPRGLALLLFCAALAAQVAPPPLSFEVASIRPAADGGVSSVGPISVNLARRSLEMLLFTAYDTGSYQQIIGPSWLDEDHFDIAAKMPQGATREQLPQMLQSLLQERFKLRAHWETRSLPAYALRIAKGGPKFTPADPESHVGLRIGMDPSPAAIRSPATAAR